MPPLPPLIQQRLQTSTRYAPDRWLPRRYRRLQARVVEQDLRWLRDHPRERARVRRHVVGEFWPLYLDVKGDCWVSVVFEPLYSGPLGYHRKPLWEGGSTPSPSHEVN